ncbi:hypothetical protein [Streptomyces sp. NBC_00038]|uniref:hypothetical protein n=1 Tax=Streptomyces sp. NBC_00038 TaxID=2903615 RepID=UPI00225C20F3|nr:hypothetical protein [Streptomyces sp. NBC_00038]MCX5558377.1 hypothetical protein [Streptomyces sp. NBC_00038]
MTTETPRGSSLPDMRRAVCKDCAREVAAGDRPAGTEYFTYPEAWAGGQLERGGSRSDRCREHRAAHVGHISGLSVAYIDLRTTGEVADRSNPTGPLGALGPLPEAHTVADTAPVDLGAFGFGMDESHIRQMLDSLADPRRRVLVVKAGTGTGKSTYMPYRLLDPPEGCYRLIDNGPIIVTEPRAPSPESRPRSEWPPSSVSSSPVPAGSAPAIRWATRCPATVITTRRADWCT